MAKDWQARLSNTLLLAGALVLYAAALLAVKTTLVEGQAKNADYLVSSSAPRLPLPTLQPTPEARRLGLEIFLPLVSKLEAAASEIAGGQPPPPAEQNPQQPAPVSGGEQPALPPPATTAGRVTRLVIPQLGVDRAVVPIGFHYSASGEVVWNTDPLFSNGNRMDLVGHLVTSVNPGDGGNIVLVGHNYNEGWNSWGGVFVNLQQLQPGSKIVVVTESGAKFQYVVEMVKKVPWQKQNSAELQKHQKYLWPSGREQLTLVTCGGQLSSSWSARIYVISTPMQQASN